MLKYHGECSQNFLNTAAILPQLSSIYLHNLPTVPKPMKGSKKRLVLLKVHPMALNMTARP